MKQDSNGTRSPINNLNWKELEAIVLDFDGVLTDNKVYVHENGVEAVCCSRADGLAFDVFREIGLPVYIFSSERNLVVKARAEKLKVSVLQGIANKYDTLRSFAQENNIDLGKTLYIGNDLNDFQAMSLCKYRGCPSDAHPRILDIANIHFQLPGGQGVMRDLVERVFNLDIVSIL